MQMHRSRQMQESSIGKLVFPDIKHKYLYHVFIWIFRLPKDYHKENMEKMRLKEQELQTKLEEEKNMPKSKSVIEF